MMGLTLFTTLRWNVRKLIKMTIIELMVWKAPFLKMYQLSQNKPFPPGRRKRSPRIKRAKIDCMLLEG
jgi:hypothetical protein